MAALTSPPDTYPLAWTRVALIKLSANGKRNPNDVIHLRQVEAFDRSGINRVLASHGGMAQQASTSSQEVEQAGHIIDGNIDGT